MKQSRLVFATVVVAALCAWGLVAFACDKGKTSASAAASNGTCTAAMAAKCTPEMAAACKAKGVSATSAAMNGACPHATSASAMGTCPHATSATTASMSGSCAAHGTSATTAAMSGSCADHGMKASAVSMNGSCCEKGTKATSATAASKGSTMIAGASGSCSAHGSASASNMAAGSSCGSHGASSAKMTAKAADCEACADMAMCVDDAKSLGANVSIVPLKNGVMFVYTADQPGRVQAVQAEMTRRSDHIAAVLAAGDKARLCADCKQLRGAIASGKLSRELVNIEGGCLTLMTSTDAAMVSKLHAMAGIKGQMKLAKS